MRMLARTSSPGGREPFHAVVAASRAVSLAACAAVGRAGGFAMTLRNGSKPAAAGGFAGADVVVVEDGAGADAILANARREWPWVRGVVLRRNGGRGGGRKARPAGVRVVGFCRTADLTCRLARALPAVAAPGPDAPDRLAVRAMAIRDPLTGLHNRRFFEAHFGHVAASERRRPLFVALVDVDHFRRVNAEQGLLGGDRVLREYAAVVARRVRAPHVLARFGGDELVVILVGLDARGAAAWAEGLRAAVGRHRFRVRGGSIRLTPSIGVVECPPPRRGGAAAAVRRADRALQTAKARGRNRVAVWSPAMGIA